MSQEKLEAIAEKTFGLVSLETKHSDQEDFHMFATWQLKDALEAAFQAGFQQGSQPGLSEEQAKKIVSLFHMCNMHAALDRVHPNLPDELKKIALKNCPYATFNETRVVFEQYVGSLVKRDDDKE